MIIIDIYTRIKYETNGFIKKIYAYYNVDRQEITQDCCLVYYSNPEIENLYVSGEKKRAYSMFLSKLRTEARKYSTTNQGVYSNDNYNREIVAMEGIYEDDFVSDFSNEFMVMYDYELLSKRISKKDLLFLDFYINNGVDITATHLGIKAKSAHQMFYRIRDKILKDDKNKELLDNYK